jgi:hypothetical protein
MADEQSVAARARDVSAGLIRGLFRKPLTTCRAGPRRCGPLRGPSGSTPDRASQENVFSPRRGPARHDPGFRLAAPCVDAGHLLPHPYNRARGGRPEALVQLGG